LIWRSASQIAELIKKREVTSKEVLEETLKQIHRIDRLYHAYITIDEEKALKQAQWVDKKIAHNEQVGPLAGVPIAVKDNICTKDLLTTCGSRILDNFYPPYDATVIKKLKKAGEDRNLTVTSSPWDLPQKTLSFFQLRILGTRRGSLEDHQEVQQ